MYWIRLLTAVLFVLPFVFFVADACACHTSGDHDQCRQTGCCSIPETHSAHRECCCMECAADTGPAVLPVDAVPARPDMTENSDLNRIPVVVGPYQIAPVTRYGWIPADIAATGPPSARHLESTILRI